MGLGVWRGGLAFGAVIFVVGYFAASKAMIAHFICFNEYPVKSADITFIEMLIHIAIIAHGQLLG